jgi:hypothetical protein
MPRSRKQKHHIPGRYVAMTYHLLESPAYRALKYPSAKLLPLIYKEAADQLKTIYGTAVFWSGDFTFTYSHAGAHGIAKATFSDVLSDLVGLGFLDCVRRGTMKKQTTVWRLSQRYQKFGTSAFVKVRWDRPKQARRLAAVLPFSEKGEHS